MKITAVYSFLPLLLIAGFATPAHAKPKKAKTENIQWHPAQSLTIEGKGWAATKNPFARLPDKAQSKVRPELWELGQDSAGVSIRFYSDAPSLHIRYALAKPKLGLSNMATMAVSSFDLYTHGPDNKMRWTKNVYIDEQKATSVLTNGLKGKNLYTLYLPLYNSPTSLEIGIPQGSSIQPAEPRSKPPIVFYGTSILQGASASRPGLSSANILGRKLDVPIINLGFSGNGRLEMEIGELMAELNASVYVIDCLPNVNPDVVEERTEPLVKLLRKARPETPIVLVEDAVQSGNKKRKALKQAFEKLTADGVTNLHYVHGDKLLPEDGEGTIDGVHPNDLGIATYVDVLEPVLRSLISK